MMLFGGLFGLTQHRKRAMYKEREGFLRHGPQQDAARNQAPALLVSTYNRGKTAYKERPRADSFIQSKRADTKKITPH